MQAVRLKIGSSYLTCKVAKKCLNLREWVELAEGTKMVPLPSPAVLSIVSVSERNP